MKVHLTQKNILNNCRLKLSGSKSESNRLLILQRLFPQLKIENLSDADDVKAMQKSLGDEAENIDIHHAGTAMRFLTAYLALCTQKKVILTGSSRMQERPIGVLVQALQQVGADIKYLNKEGYPPLQINGKKAEGGKVVLQADVSSQFITALLLVGSSLPKGLEVQLLGTITSKPYIEMTLSLLNQIGIQTEFNKNKVVVFPASQILPSQITVESDWSSASYFYSMIALSPIGTQITLKHFKQNSLQGDAAVAEIYKLFGVQTTFQSTEIILKKAGDPQVEFLILELNNTPDLAQTIAVTCFGLNLPCELTGLHTLKIKETDRLSALQTELKKLGGKVTITADSLKSDSHQGIKKGISIDTYQDHRMAMAFAPLAIQTDLSVNNAEVVSKSFINFWECLQKTGFDLEYKK